MRLAGPIESDTPLGRVSFEVVPKPFAGLDAFVPIADWGIRADVFESLYGLDVEVRSIDRKAAIDAAAGSRATLTETREELGAGAREAILRASLCALGAGIVAAALLVAARPRSRLARRMAFAIAGISLVVVGGSAIAAWATFDRDKLATPGYYGRGQELAQLLTFLERQADNDRYSSTFEHALENFSAYLSDSSRPGDGTDQSLLIGSDLHNNLPVLSVLGEFLDEETVLLTGDFAHEGNESEARALARRLTSLSRRVIAVSGNHDSTQLMRTLAGSGLTVLTETGRLDEDGGVTPPPLMRVGAVGIAGYPDPLEWTRGDPSSPDRVFSFPELEDGEEAEARAKADLVTWFNDLARQPDILLVHQNALAQHLAASLAEGGHDEALTIVTGHNHYQHIDRYANGRITVVNPGTLGAGGPLRVGQEAAGLGQLHLDREDGSLEAVDLIQIEPLSGHTAAERVILDAVCPPDDLQDPCHYEPDGL